MNELEALRRKLAKQGLIFNGFSYVHTTDADAIAQYLNSDSISKPKKRKHSENDFFG